MTENSFQSDKDFTYYLQKVNQWLLVRGVNIVDGDSLVDLLSDMWSQAKSEGWADGYEAGDELLTKEGEGEDNMNTFKVTLLPHLDHYNRNRVIWIVSLATGWDLEITKLAVDTGVVELPDNGSGVLAATLIQTLGYGYVDEELTPL